MRLVPAITDSLKDMLPWKLVNSLCAFPPFAGLAHAAYAGMFAYLKILGLHINTECNYDCAYCYTDRKCNALATADWIKIIDDAKRLGVLNINFVGGEPLLHKDLSYLLSYTAKRKFNIGIFTNGSLLDERWFREIKALPVRTYVAIKYDYDAETYHKHTGKGELFQKVCRSIKACAESGIRTVTFTTLTAHNVDFAREIVDSSVKLGAYPVFERYVPVQGPEVNKGLEVDARRYTSAMKQVAKAYEKARDVIHGKCHLTGRFCYCYMGEISITPDGFALPCAYAPKALNIGNVRQDPIGTIWKRYQKERKKWVLPRECSSCRSRSICGGGCKTHAFLKYGDVNKKDPLCEGFPPVYGQCGWCAMHYTLDDLFSGKP